MQFRSERMQNASPANIGRAMRTLLGFQGYLKQSGLEESLHYLIEIRASQINGCAFCLDMHIKDALASGEDLQRLYMLSAWRESPFYTDRERAALAWTEAVTLVADGHIPDEAYEAVRPYFDDDALVALTMAVVAINSFNRLNVAMRTYPNYEPGAAAQVAAEMGAGASA